jgi:iron(III) transport system ATP-binding protein
MTFPAVESQAVSKSYSGVQALDAVSLSIHEGEILALLGPSGCGKTTLLRLIAGFEKPDSGEIIVGGTTVAADDLFYPAETRRVGMVFQAYALFPHLSVAKNVAYGLDHRKRTNADNRLIEELLEIAGVSHLQDRYPHQLSGGERQRVALIRALAPQPVVVLLDEPFSNLDADRRLRIREQVRRILKERNSTALFVTHDQDEAFFMGDRLAVMRDGKVEQIGVPEDVFHAPRTKFIANFLGQADFIPGQSEGNYIQTELGKIGNLEGLAEGLQIEVGFRPDDVDFKAASETNAMVIERVFKGSANLYKLKLKSGKIIQSMQPHFRIVNTGAAVQVSLTPEHSLPCYLNGHLINSTSD